MLSSSMSLCWFYLVLGVVLCCCCNDKHNSIFVSGEKVVLFFGIYPGRAADFGMEIPDYEDRINIMYAPISTNNSLCHYPKDLPDTSSYYSASSSSSNVDDVPNSDYYTEIDNGADTATTTAGDDAMKSSNDPALMTSVPEDGSSLFSPTTPAPAAATQHQPPQQDLYVNAVDSPIALLIHSDDCSAEQQALVAAKLQKRVSGKIKYIIVQGTPEAGDYLQVLYPQSEDYDPSINNIGIIYITYRTGVYILQHISRKQMMWGGSPYIFGESNEYWSMITNIEVYKHPNARNGINGGTSNDSFYWFRVLLFTLLIVSPCCRAGYLWWAGGGRIRFRRNENGWINGFQYIPPVPYWLSNGLGPGRPYEEHRNVLSEEEFNLLPEVIYQPENIGRPQPKTDDDDNDDGNDSNQDDAKEIIDENLDAADDDAEVDVNLKTAEKKIEESAMGDEDVEQPRSTSSTLNTTGETVGLEEDEDYDREKDRPGSENTNASKKKISSEKSNCINISQSTDAETEPSDGVTSDNSIRNRSNTNTNSGTATEGVGMNCTMCSICIDDFEPGEKLILLPKCKHAFHRDCIHPWLTERQGCCPLCKTYVIDMPSMHSSTGDDDVDVEESNYASYRQRHLEHRRTMAAADAAFGPNPILFDPLRSNPTTSNRPDTSVVNTYFVTIPERAENSIRASIRSFSSNDLRQEEEGEAPVSHRSTMRENGTQSDTDDGDNVPEISLDISVQNGTPDEQRC